MYACLKGEGRVVLTVQKENKTHQENWMGMESYLTVPQSVFAHPFI